MYGAFGAFTTITATGNTPCTDATFGDPIHRKSKVCYTATGGPPGYTTACSAEDGTCAFSEQQTICLRRPGRFVHR